MASRVMPRAEAEADGFHALNVPFHDVRHRHLWRFWYHDMYQRIGNEFKFSPGFGTDLWAYLSNDIPTAYLVVAYFVFELVFIGAFGVLLLVTKGIDPGGFMRCLLASHQLSLHGRLMAPVRRLIRLFCEFSFRASGPWCY